MTELCYPTWSQHSLLSIKIHIQDKTHTVAKRHSYIIYTEIFRPFNDLGSDYLCDRKSGALQTSHLLFQSLIYLLLGEAM